MSQACPLFLVFPGASNTPLSPLSSARSWDRAPSSNRFHIAAYLDPRVGPQGTWVRDTIYACCHFRIFYFPSLIMVHILSMYGDSYKFIEGT